MVQTLICKDTAKKGDKTHLTFLLWIRYTAILFKMKLRKLYGTKRKKDNYAMTDLTFLVLFPILFLAFNVLYWTGVYWTRTF